MRIVKIEKPEHWRSDIPNGVGGIKFRVWVDDQEILCRVPRRVLDIHCNQPTSDDARLEAARQQAEKIAEIVRRRIKLGGIPSGGIVWINVEDW